MLNFHLVKHFFIHGNLLSKGRLYSISFLFNLFYPILEKAIEGFKLSQFVGVSFIFLESCDLSIKDVVSELTRGIAHISEGCLSIFLRRKIFELGRRLVPLTNSTSDQMFHSNDKNYFFKL